MVEPPGPEAAADHVPGGSYGVGDAKAGMLEEVTILARQQRLDQMGGNVLDPNDFALLVAEELGDQAAVTIQDPGWQRRPVALVYVEAANVAGGGQGKATGSPHRQGDAQAGDGSHPGEE